MLSFLEKFQYGFSVLILVLVGLIPMLAGWFETQSQEFLRVIELTPRADALPRPVQPGSVAQEPPRPAVPARLRPVVDKLVEQGVRRQKAELIKTRTYSIPSRTYAYISKPGNWFKELNKAASRTIAGKGGDPTMLELFDIEEGSRFEMFGVQNGDVVTLIDEDIIEFRDDRYQDHVQLAQRLFDKLDKGEPISFTVLRDGIPVNLEFSVGK